MTGPFELADGTDVRHFIKESLLERHRSACLRCAQARWGGESATPSQTGSTSETFETRWGVQLAIDGRLLTQADVTVSARMGYDPIDFQVFARPVEAVPSGQISVECGWRLAAVSDVWMPEREREWTPTAETRPRTEASNGQGTEEKGAC